MSFWQERALSFIIATIPNVQIANNWENGYSSSNFEGSYQINLMGGHMFLLWSISSLGSHLTPRKTIGNLSVSFGRKRALYQLINLRDHIKKSHGRTYYSFVINLITRVWSNYEAKIRKFAPCRFDRRGRFSFIIAKIPNVQIANNWENGYSSSNFEGVISKNLMEGHMFLLWSISSLGFLLTLRGKIENMPVSFGRKRALYQLIGSKKAQFQTLRDHIKKISWKDILFFCNQSHHKGLV